MDRISTCVRVGVFVCAALQIINSQTVLGQTNVDSQRQPVRQTLSDLAALPAADSGLESNPIPKQFNRTFYRQASAQSGVYTYPAAGPPRLGGASGANNALSRNNANSLISSQLTSGSSVSTGNLGSRTQVNSQAPSYNINPAQPGTKSRQTLATNLRSPVVQQTSSTMRSVAPNNRSNSGPTNLRQNVQRQDLNSQTAVNGAANNGANSAQQAQAQAYQLAQQAQAQQAQAQARAAQLAQANQAAFRQTAYQRSTLGLGGPVARTAQNCNCAPVYAPTQAFSPPQGFNPAGAAFQAPALNPNVGTGLGLPPLNIQQPGFAQQGQAGQFFGQQAIGTPQFGTPQFGAQGARWWTPFVSGSGVYTPLLKLQNMPIGTYLGQGVIGQPTAYVDGQPVRNLLRYISP